MIPAIEATIRNDTAGSPVDQSIRWTNRSAVELAIDLQEQGFEIGPDALRRILFEEMDLSRRQAYKDESACHFPFRDEQFQYIAELRQYYEERNWPVISVDTKKKEILGDFFHPGRAYTDSRVIVRDHDFVAAQDRLVPYGVYDTGENNGLVLLARGSDSSLLASDAIWRWWRRLGHHRYRHAWQMLLLCDCGGSNGNRQWRFKEDLCHLAAKMHCDIQVAHYPPGCSKYNPIEHRMFCHVSRSLQAVVIRTIEIAREFIARTSTAHGLRVVAEIARRSYEKGRKATKEFVNNSPIQFDEFLPQLNYTAPYYAML